MVNIVAFVLMTAAFWFIISSNLQKLGLTVLALTLPCSFPETRGYVWRYVCGADAKPVELDPKRRTLGFGCEDVYDVVASGLIYVEQHADFLKGLKHTSSYKLYMLLATYVVVLLATFLFVPLAGILYVSFILLFFVPVLNYVNVVGVLMGRVRTVLHPMLLHWNHSRTKRNRNRTRHRHTQPHHKTDSDIENEEFIPMESKECKKVLDEEIMRHVSTSDHEEEAEESGGEDMDEFQLRGEFLKKQNEVRILIKIYWAREGSQK